MTREFQAGDKIRMLQDCSGCIKGEVYTLVDIDDGSGIKADCGTNGVGCTCQSLWELVEEGFLADDYVWLKAGQLCDVYLDCMSPLAGGKALKIREVRKDDGLYLVWSKQETDFWSISALYIRRHVPEEDNAEQEAMESLSGKEVEVVVDGKTYKAKII